MAQSPTYDLEILDRGVQRFAITTFDGVKAEAALRADDWDSPMFDIIVRRVFTRLLSLPQADIDFSGFAPSSVR